MKITQENAQEVADKLVIERHKLVCLIRRIDRMLAWIQPKFGVKLSLIDIGQDDWEGEEINADCQDVHSLQCFPHLGTGNLPELRRERPSLGQSCPRLDEAKPTQVCQRKWHSFFQVGSDWRKTSSCKRGHTLLR